MPWTPKGWTSLVDGGTTDEERAERICRCVACERDGVQHEPMCNVHADEMGGAPCDCGREAWHSAEMLFLAILKVGGAIKNVGVVSAGLHLEAELAAFKLFGVKPTTENTEMVVRAIDELTEGWRAFL